MPLKSKDLVARSWRCASDIAAGSFDLFEPIEKGGEARAVFAG